MQPLTNDPKMDAYLFYLSTLEHTEFPEIMNRHSNDIYDIYSKLKKNSISENNNTFDNIIKEIIKEIKKNKYSNVQYFILAQLLFRLKNIDTLSIEELYYPKIKWYNKKKFTTNISKLEINEKVKSIVDKLSSNKLYEDIKKKDIILRFTDEFNEVSKEKSELGEKILRFLYHNKILVVIKYLINSLQEINIDSTIEILIEQNIFKNLLEGPLLINLNDFLKSLFKYSISVIDKEKIKDILTYILYFLVNNDMGIPIEIHKLFDNGNFNASNDIELGKILNLLGELSENLTLRRLFYLLSKQKRKFYRNKSNLLKKPDSNVSVNKSNNDIKFIKKTLNKQTDLIKSLSKYMFDDIKIIFLNELFTYIGNSIKNDKVRNILTYIIYLLVKDDIKIPQEIDNTTINFEKATLDKRLNELLNFVVIDKQEKMRRLFHLLQKEKMKKLKSITVEDSSFVSYSNANSNKSPEEYIKTTLDNLSKNNDIATALTLIVSKFSIQDKNKINFLQELFKYVLHNIKEKHIIDILTYIVYSLVIDDKNIPAKIPAKITEKFEKLIANTNNLNSESNNKFSKFSKQFERNFILNRLLYILFKLLPKKESSYKYSTPRPPRPPSYSNPSSSSNSKNYLNNLKNYDSINTTDPRSFLAEIKRRINAITQERRDIFVQNLIDSILKDNISKNILRIFPDFNMFRLPLFLSKLFGYFSDEFLKDETIKKILTYIVYSLINTDLNINNVDHLPLYKELEDILMEIFEVNTQIPEILIKLFKILTKRIEELNELERKK